MPYAVLLEHAVVTVHISHPTQTPRMYPR